MTAAAVVDPSQGKTDAAEGGSLPAENCLTRLRHRRLLSFLRDQRYDGAFNALLHQAREQFSLEHMQRLVTQGLWEDAAGYLDNFLPAGPRSLDAQVLYNFLLMHHHIARFVAGDAAAVDAILANDWMRYVTYAQQTADQVAPPVTARSVLLMEDLRARMDWGEVRSTAACYIYRLVWQTPELKRKLTLPARHVMPHDVLPIGHGLCRRRHLKKQGPRLKSVAVARAIRSSRRYIRHLKESSFESFDETKKWLSTVIDNSLQGGVPVGCYVLQPSGKEDTGKSREGCYVEIENARLSIYLRKNQRATQTIAEDCFGWKKHRTTGAFGDTSMARV